MDLTRKKDENIRDVPECVLDQIYIAMCDARERLDKGTDSLTQCINYLSLEQGYERPRQPDQIQEEPE